MELPLATDSITWRGMERLLVVLGAIVFAFLGYKLYTLGIAEGSSKVDVSSRWIAFAVSGTGPGLVLMALGAMILVLAMLTGGAVHTISEQITRQIADDLELISFRVENIESNVAPLFLSSQVLISGRLDQIEGGLETLSALTSRPGSGRGRASSRPTQDQIRELLDKLLDPGLEPSSAPTSRAGRAREYFPPPRGLPERLPGSFPSVPGSFR